MKLASLYRSLSLACIINSSRRPARHTKTSVFSRVSVEANLRLPFVLCQRQHPPLIAALTPSLNHDARTALGWVGWRAAGAAAFFLIKHIHDPHGSALVLCS